MRRVLLDSNVWLAILTTDGFCRRLWRGSRARCTFVTSQDILAEVEAKLRGKFGFSARQARLMTLFVRRQSVLVAVVSNLNVCRDKDDDCILAAAVDSHCTELVTGDSDLLALSKFGDVSIVTPRRFMESISRIGR